MPKILKCAGCGDTYRPEDLQELREMGERVYLHGRRFLCPDCFDDYHRMTPEEKADLLAGPTPLKKKGETDA